LTIVNFRPGYHAPWMSRSYYQQIALPPLGPEAVDELLVALLGADRSLQRVVDLIRERTQGNPFFIEEVVRTLVEAGSLAGESGAYRLVQNMQEISVPASVYAVLAARIDRLEPEQKSVLEAAAVVGREFLLPVLEDVAGGPPGGLDETLRELVAGEFVYEQKVHPERAFAFAHPLTREVAYRSQLLERRKTLHAATARSIANRYPELHDERAALLAQHWEAAGDLAEAARWYVRAALWSGSGDPTQAFRHWSKVRELADALPDSGQATSLRLQARASLLNYAWRVGISDEAALELFREADLMARQAGDLRAQSLVAAAYTAIRKICQGDDRGAASDTRNIFTLAEASGDHALYLTVALQAYPYYSTGDYRAGLAIHERALNLANGDPTTGAGVSLACPYANSVVFKAVFLTPLGALREAAELFELGRRLAQEHDDLEVVSWSHMWSVWLAYFQGESDAALQHGRQAVEIAERIGGSFSRVVAWFHRGGAELIGGEPRLAVEALERSAALADERGIKEHDGWRLALLGESYLRLGETERATQLARRGREIAHARGNLCEETHASLAVARILLHAPGQPERDEIEVTLARALELAGQTDAKAFEPLVHVELAELARRTGDAAGRERALRKAHQLFTAIGASAHARRLPMTEP
jgi:adenylate cyclase